MMQSMSVEELHERIRKGEKINLLDVREASEYEVYHLGGELIPLGEVMRMNLNSIEDRRDEEWVVHCKSGKRSLQACLYLQQAGFTRLYNLEGGAEAWKQKYGDQKVRES